MRSKKKKNDQQDLITEAAGSGSAENAGAAAAVEGDYNSAEQAELVRQMRLRDANIPARYLDKTLDNFQARSKQLKEVVNFARDYARTLHRGRSQQGLFIYGCTGCGKSHIASAILKLVMERDFSGYWLNMTDLMTTIRDVISRNAPREDLDFVEMKCAECDLLVLDDMGVESAKGMSLERLYWLVNRRYESNRPIIVTSNLDVEELSRQFQDENRIMSRICEICTRFAPFPDVDYRMKNLK